MFSTTHAHALKLAPTVFRMPIVHPPRPSRPEPTMTTPASHTHATPTTTYHPTHRVTQLRELSQAVLEGAPFLPPRVVLSDEELEEFRLIAAWPKV